MAILADTVAVLVVTVVHVPTTMSAAVALIAILTFTTVAVPQAQVRVPTKDIRLAPRQVPQRLHHPAAMVAVAAVRRAAVACRQAEVASRVAEVADTAAEVVVDSPEVGVAAAVDRLQRVQRKYKPYYN